MEVINRQSPYGTSTQQPNRIILHSIAEYIRFEGELLYAPEFLEKIKLSAHALIAPDGTLIRTRQDKEGAYHAKSHNKNTLGVEIMVAGEHDYSSFLKTIEKQSKRCYVLKKDKLPGYYR